MRTNFSGAVHAPDYAGCVTKDEEPKNYWKLKDLGARWSIDAASAAVAAGLVAPIVTVVDKYAFPLKPFAMVKIVARRDLTDVCYRAVAEGVSGRNSFIGSLSSSLRRLILRPHTFLFARPSAIMMLLYSCTYLTANVIDTISSTAQGQPASTTTSGFTKFGAVSLVNLSLALYKDSQFTRMFGIISPRPLPPVSYALLALRDSLTIFASFNLPPKLAPMLPDSVEDHFSRLSVAQFTAPALIQILNTPLHLLGLNLYNQNCPTPVRDRLRKVRLDWPATSLARMCRVLPAFGVGGVVNYKVRAKMMDEFDQARTASIDRNI